jgi:hypothetical protein
MVSSGNGSWPLDRDEPPGTSGAALSFEGDGFGFKVIDEHTIEADDSTKVHLDISGTHLKVKVAQVKIRISWLQQPGILPQLDRLLGGNASMTRRSWSNRR